MALVQNSHNDDPRFLSLQHGPRGIRHNWHQEAGGTSTTAQVRMSDSLLTGPPSSPGIVCRSPKQFLRFPVQELRHLTSIRHRVDLYAVWGCLVHSDQVHRLTHRSVSCNYSLESSGLYTLSPILIRFWAPFRHGHPSRTSKLLFFSPFFLHLPFSFWSRWRTGLSNTYIF